MLAQRMSVINKAMGAVKRGQLHPMRFRKAFSILQSKDMEYVLAKYRATINGCGCPDHSVRGITCKHMITMMVLYRVDKAAYKLMLADRKIREWNNQYYVVNQEIGGWRTHIFFSKDEAYQYCKLTTTCDPRDGKGRRLPDVYGV